MRFAVAASVLSTTITNCAASLSSTKGSSSSTAHPFEPPFEAGEGSSNDGYGHGNENSNNGVYGPSEESGTLGRHSSPPSHRSLTNTGVGDGNDPTDTQTTDAGIDIGILSFRKLQPAATDETSNAPDSPAFDLFRIVDDDKTNFGFLCNPAEDGNPESIYDCSTCERIGDTSAPGTGTVGSFVCRTPVPSSSSAGNCYEINSRCPNNVMTVCRYDTLQRILYGETDTDTDSVSVSATGESSTSTSTSTSSYSSERCRRIEATLTKTDRPVSDEEESSWEFSYCMRYNIGENGYSCEMEADGVVCSSCRLETLDAMDENGLPRREFCATFDCGNTVLGYSGRFCRVPSLSRTALDYFVYRSLPCDGGCNLCGSFGDAEASGGPTMAMMEFRGSSFATPGSGSALKNCFGAQWEALVGPTEDSYCEAAVPLVRESCRCTPRTILRPGSAASSAEAGPWLGGWAAAVGGGLVVLGCS